MTKRTTITSLRKQRQEQKERKERNESRHHSGNGFMTPIWGPMLWAILHMISMNYPVHPTAAEKRHYGLFVQYLSHVLPCGNCRTNMQENLRRFPLGESELQSRDTFSLWMYEFHQRVNVATGKDINRSPSYDTMMDMYELFRARCSKVASEVGCIVPANNVDTKCILSIVPKSDSSPGGSIHIDKRCM